MRGRGGALVVAMTAAWLASRAVLAWLLTGPQAWVGGDVGYFAGSLESAGEVGLAGVLVEYPLPAVAVLAVPWALAEILGVSYGAVLLVTAALTDLAFTVLLALAGRASGSGWWPAASWLVAVPALGSTAFARFDLLPGVLAGLAVLAVASRPRVAATCLAVATGAKLWPLVLAPPLLAAARRTAVGVYFGIGAALAAGTVLLAGVARLFSPLAYQVERGLQIESVAATPAMLAWWLRPGPWTVAYAPSNAYEITGPAVDGLLGVATVTGLLYAGLVAAGGALLARLWWHGRAVRPPTLVWCGLVGVLGFVVTGKVLSPQYLLWLLPLAAAGLVVADGPGLRRWTLGLLVATVLTHVVFPGAYGAITAGIGAAWLPVLALTARNALLVLLFGAAVVEAWRCLRSELADDVSAAASSPASRRHRSATTRARHAAGTPTPSGAEVPVRVPQQRSPAGRRRAQRPPRGWRRP